MDSTTTLRATSHPCPTCPAASGQRCQTRGGNPARTHTARLGLANAHHAARRAAKAGHGDHPADLGCAACARIRADAASLARMRGQLTPDAATDTRERQTEVSRGTPGVGLGAVWAEQPRCCPNCSAQLDENGDCPRAVEFDHPTRPTDGWKPTTHDAAAHAAATDPDAASDTRARQTGVPRGTLDAEAEAAWAEQPECPLHYDSCPAPTPGGCQEPPTQPDEPTCRVHATCADCRRDPSRCPVAHVCPPEEEAADVPRGTPEPLWLLTDADGVPTAVVAAPTRAEATRKWAQTYLADDIDAAVEAADPDDGDYWRSVEPFGFVLDTALAPQLAPFVPAWADDPRNPSRS